ncbi:hypothetical protein [Actinacidiphila epipremni]|uniref:Uncharacterized protein n=1 Tax=Actinacidiphila epipremni TaxID=2053013 RepID=A0ABX0ZNR9_9ACTN|nr:hypothetical protein [Actinacidiphila epipremni]NJP43288.1 hypothetical protein [Actinacidiphila epipremni]
MSDKNTNVVPVWTLSTAGGAPVPAITGKKGLTAERLVELRAALAAFAEAPLVTVEAHPLTNKHSRSAGLLVGAVSPLAQELSRLVTENAGNVPAVNKIAESGEVLYRMVVPAKVAAQVGKGLVGPMVSKAAPNGVYSALVDKSTGLIAAKAVFVPVEAAGAAGAAGAAAGTAVAGTALAVAAPLVLMAIALGASAYADQQRQGAIRHITELLEKLRDEALEQERSELAGCRDAIDKATAVLLDQGKLGASLGLDSAVHAISKATERAELRLEKWEAGLDALGDGRADVTDLEATFAGIAEDGGEFRTHLELAALAIALKRRVNVLQGVEAGQNAPDNPFESFVRSLDSDQRRIDELEARIANVLLRLSSLELCPPKRLSGKVMTRGQVDALLETSYRLRALADGVAAAGTATEVVIDIEKHSDGSLLVLPAHAA